jgi:hypothetical protein
MTRSTYSIARFVLSETCWQDDADLEAVCGGLAPAGFLDRLRTMMGIERHDLRDLKRLRWGSEEHLYGGDLKAGQWAASSQAARPWSTSDSLLYIKPISVKSHAVPQALDPSMRIARKSRIKSGLPAMIDRSNPLYAVK